MASNPLNTEPGCVTWRSMSNSAPGATVKLAGVSATVTPCAHAAPASNTQAAAQSAADPDRRHAGGEIARIISFSWWVRNGRHDSHDFPTVLQWPIAHLDGRSLAIDLRERWSRPIQRDGGGSSSVVDRGPIQLYAFVFQGATCKDSWDWRA